MSGIAIEDYVPDQEVQLEDPTDPYDQVEKAFMDKLAKMITHGEEALQAGDYSLDSDEFFDRRGSFLDLLDDPQVAEWLNYMRTRARAPYRRFSVRG